MIDFHTVGRELPELSTSPLPVLAMHRSRACGYYRLEMPLRELERRRLVQLLQPDASAHTRRVERYPAVPSVIVMHRPVEDAQYFLGVRRRDHGQSVLLVIDDDDDLISMRCGETMIERKLQRGLDTYGLHWDPDELVTDAFERIVAAAVDAFWALRALPESLCVAEGKRLLGRTEITAGRDSGKVAEAIVREARRRDGSRIIARAIFMQAYGVRDYKACIRCADLVTVSTPTLARVMRPFQRHIAVLPNCLDLTLPAYQAGRTQRPDLNTVVIGWAGLDSHVRDLPLCVDALARLMTECDGTAGKPRLQLMIGGRPLHFEGALKALPGASAFCRRIADVNGQWWKQSHGLWTIRSQCGRYIFRMATADVEAVPAMYTDVDIGIVPNVLPSIGNRARSDVKGLEMAGMGVPCVASPIPSYQEWRGKPGTGAIVLDSNEPEAWEAALRRLIIDPGFRRRMSAEARAFAETRSIVRWAPKWLEAYQAAARRTGKPWAA